MVFEPVSGTIGAIAFVKTALDACEQTYTACRQISTFAYDFHRFQQELDVRWQHLLDITGTRISELADDCDPNDTKIKELVVRQLNVIKGHFESCNRVANHYRQEGE